MQGEVYAKFVEAELKLELDRRAALITRANGVITTTGAVVAFLAALTVILVGRDFRIFDMPVTSAAPVDSPAEAASKDSSELSTVTLWLFVAAVSLAMISAIIATWASQNFRKITAAKPATYWAMVNEHRTDPEEVALNEVAAHNIRRLVTLRSGNNSKATILRVGCWIQVVSFSLLAGALGVAWIDHLNA